MLCGVTDRASRVVLCAATGPRLTTRPPPFVPAGVVIASCSKAAWSGGAKSGIADADCGVGSAACAENPEAPPPHPETTTAASPTIATSLALLISVFIVSPFALFGHRRRE